MDGLKTYIIGESVKWMDGKKECNGIVRDDLGNKVIVLCIKRDGRSVFKKLRVKKEILMQKEVVKKNVRYLLMYNRFKNYTKLQLLDDLGKGRFSDFEKGVVKDILVEKGSSDMELAAYGLIDKGDFLEKGGAVVKSIFLDRSEEVDGLFIGSNVMFMAHNKSEKYGNVVMHGIVTRIYKWHKAKFSEYCKIKAENGKIFSKRTNCIRLQD